MQTDNQTGKPLDLDAYKRSNDIKKTAIYAFSANRLHLQQIETN